MDDFPAMSIELVSRLNVMFPEVISTPETPLREVDFKSGQRSVITLLNSLLEESNARNKG